MAHNFADGLAAVLQQESIAIDVKYQAFENSGRLNEASWQCVLPTLPGFDFAAVDSRRAGDGFPQFVDDNPAQLVIWSADGKAGRIAMTAAAKLLGNARDIDAVL